MHYRADFLNTVLSASPSGRQAPCVRRQRCETGIVSLAGAATSIIFVATDTCFVATKHVFCRDERMHAATKTKYVFCRDKHVFVATKESLSRQMFILLSRQKMILVAAPVNDNYQPPTTPSAPMYYSPCLLLVSKISPSGR